MVNLLRSGLLTWSCLNSFKGTNQHLSLQSLGLPILNIYSTSSMKLQRCLNQASFVEISTSSFDHFLLTILPQLGSRTKRNQLYLEPKSILMAAFYEHYLINMCVAKKHQISIELQNNYRQLFSLNGSFAFKIKDWWIRPDILWSKKI